MKIKKINSDYIIGLLVFLLFMLIYHYNLPLIIDIESKLYKLGSGYVKTGDDGYNQVIVINIKRSDCEKYNHNTTDFVPRIEKTNCSYFATVLLKTITTKQATLQ